MFSVFRGLSGTPTDKSINRKNHIVIPGSSMTAKAIPSVTTSRIDV